jgi:LCP family protein required for cell wall assembly
MEDDRSGQRPLPPRLDPRAGDTRPAKTGARTTRRGVVLFRVLAGMVSVLVLGTCGWGWHLTRVAEASVNRTDAIPDGQNSHNGAEMNLLLVGDDSRSNLTPAQMNQLNAGSDGGSQNTDTMMLLHVPADGSRASFVSFPRDSYVQIPGHGWDKLNAAFALGYNSVSSSASEDQKTAAGQQLLVRTISQLSGLQIDHYASVDLLGFYNLSTVVGGVDVNLCAPVKDSYSGANFPAGVQTISGADALKFVRQRHGLPRGDLDRVVRQQVFLAGVVRKMMSQNVLLNPAKQQQLVSAAAKSLTVDQSLNLLQLAQQMQSLTAGGVNFQTLPILGDGKDPQGRDILQLPDTPALHAYFSGLSNPPGAAAAAPTSPAAPTPAKTVAPSAVSVQVLNGTTTSGLAAKAGGALTAAGFTVAGTGNADTLDYSATEIRFAAGDDARAATLAAKIPGATTTQKSGVTPGTVQLVLGSNFQGVGQPVAAAAPSAPAAASSAEPPRTAADTGCIN